MSLIITHGEQAYSGDIVIPNEVTYNGRSLKVTKVDDEAFKNTDLLSIILPQDLLSIGRSAFEGCKSIKEIIFPTSVQWIEKSAFKGCIGLTSLTLPDNLLSINDSVFWGCTGLRSIVFPQHLKSIGKLSFGECLGLTDLEVSAETIDSAFVNCSNLRTVSLGANVISILGTFQNCYNLETISFGTSISAIYTKAFANCKKLTKIVIPPNIIDIRFNVFSGCSSLKTIVFEDTKKSVDIDKYSSTRIEALFSGCPLDSVYLGRPMLYKPKVMQYYIPPFVGTPLRKIEAGENFYFDGVQMFENLDSIEYINLSKVTYLKSISFKNCRNLKKVALPDSINKSFQFYWDPFENCTSLTSVNLPNVISEIKNGMFRGCTSLKEINLDNIRWFGKESFRDCISLDSLFITGFSTIGENAFQNCYGLKKIEINRGEDLVSNPTEIGVRAFDGCTSLQSIKIYSSKQLNLSSFAFKGCTSLNKIEIEAPILEMESAFDSCTSLSILYLPNCKIKSINTFHNCTNLKTVVFPDGINGVLYQDFWGCTSLNNVISYILNPQMCPIYDSFDNDKYFTATLYVPEGTKDIYLAEQYWKNFFNISEFNPNTFEIETLGIGDLNNDTKVCSRYSINGNKLSAPTKGVNIIKMNNGKIKKVMMK